MGGIVRKLDAELRFCVCSAYAQFDIFCAKNANGVMVYPVDRAVMLIVFDFYGDDNDSARALREGGERCARAVSVHRRR